MSFRNLRSINILKLCNAHQSTTGKNKNLDKLKAKKKKASLDITCDDSFPEAKELGTKKKKACSDITSDDPPPKAIELAAKKKKASSDITCDDSFPEAIEIGTKKKTACSDITCDDPPPEAIELEAKKNNAGSDIKCDNPPPEEIELRDSTCDDPPPEEIELRDSTCDDPPPEAIELEAKKNNAGSDIKCDNPPPEEIELRDSTCDDPPPEEIELRDSTCDDPPPEAIELEAKKNNAGSDIKCDNPPPAEIELRDSTCDDPPPELMELGDSTFLNNVAETTTYDPDQNYDTLIQHFEFNESDFSEGSNDKNYAPSSSKSSSDDDHDLEIETECLDGSYKVTITSDKENEMASEEYLKQKHKTNEEELEEEAETNNHLEVEEGKLQDTGTSSEDKSKRIREKDFCFYCETLVLNFSRHVVRNHIAEPEVQSAISMPKNSLARKKTFADLRKKGNFVSNSQTGFKPVKKCRFSDRTDYLPCSKCLGFYSRKQLWRHVKICNNTTSSNNVQVQAQNFLVRHVKVDNHLVETVFPRMKPDKISLVAKKDKLICMFGAQYLRTHREEHFATVVSRKMRELSKLLMEVTKLNPSITNLEQVLKPQYYDTLVHATKVVARFNEDKKQFDAPTYAMNIATSIKQCCSIALLEICKKEATIHTSAVQADLKTLSKLISENWKFDISSQAADDLNVKRWNKTTIVPLATDLKLFKDHLENVSKQSSENLAMSNDNMDIQAFNNLVEATYCRVLLLNRRRPGELQRLKLSDYNDHGNDSNKYEEFENVLSATEKILVDTLKRIVIRGKRGRGVPVLFSADVQDDIKRILSVRQKYIEENNNLLFVKAGGGTICGYKILKKYAKACGAKNFHALTSTRLRKHLATMTQLFTMNESELEQLATFMGHTLSVHKDNYRLPSDVYQTAKISKLLLLMEDGKADKYKGKTLDEIDINMLDEVIGEEIENEEVVEFQQEAEPIQNINLSNTESVLVEESANKTTSDINRKKKRTLVPWTTQQKSVVIKYFKDHINNKRPPKRAECEDLKTRHPTLLHNKDWLKIKVFVQNTYTKK